MLRLTPVSSIWANTKHIFVCPRCNDIVMVEICLAEEKEWKEGQKKKICPMNREMWFEMSQKSMNNLTRWNDSPLCVLHSLLGAR